MPKIIIILLLLLGSGYFIYSNVYNSKSYISHDTVISGNYRLEKNSNVVVVGGSKLTVEGDATLEGKLECDKGPIYLKLKEICRSTGILNAKEKMKKLPVKLVWALF